MRVVSWFKKQYELLQLKNVAIVAVMITQAIKRIVQSEVGLIILDLVPLPWANIAGKILGISKKVTEVLPHVVGGIVASKGLLDITESKDYKLALKTLTDHLSNYSDKDLNEFLKFMSMQILNARSNDGLIDDNEKSEMIESAYQFLFKK